MFFLRTFPMQSIVTVFCRILGAVLTVRGVAANGLRQRLLLEAGDMRKNDLEVDRALNFHCFSSSK